MSNESGFLAAGTQTRQRTILRNVYMWMTAGMSSNVAESDFIRLSIIGALKLYLDFINMFLFLLRIFGRRR